MTKHPNKILDSDIIGFKFGKLLPVRLNPIRTKSRGKRFDCLCDCGKKVVVRASSLRGGVESCGCLRVDLLKKRVTKHGMTTHSLYNVWSGMIQRCENNKNPRYKNYGAKGISVCRRWRENSSSFFEWAIKNGWEKNLHIDRKNNNKGYSPENCHFISPAENNRNQSTSCRWMVKGKVFNSSTTAGKEFGVSKSTIMRWCKGYTTDKGNYSQPKPGCGVERVYE